MKKLFVFFILLFPASILAQEPVYQYTTVPITYEQQNWLNLNQTNAGNNFADDEARNIQIGFDFTFYGETFNTLNLSNNGLLNFNSSINGCCSGQILPTSSMYDYSIFFLWTDLVNINTTNPYFNTYGEEGNRRFTIGFYDMPVFYDSTLRSTVEVTLFEGSNYVFLNYGDVNTGNRAVTAGLQGSSLSGEYTQLYHGNDAGSTLSNTSWLFYPGVYVEPEDPKSNEPDCNVEFYAPSCQTANNAETTEQQNVTQEPVIITQTTMQFEPENMTQQETVEEIALEEMLSVEAREERTDNLETANAMADNIDANVLDIVLSIVEATGSSEQSTQQTSSTTASTNTESSSIDTSMDSSVAESAEAAFEILAQGQAFAQDSIANTVEQSQNEVMAIESFVSNQQEIVANEEIPMIAYTETMQEIQQQDNNIVNEFGQIQIIGDEFNQPEQLDDNKILVTILANSQESNKQDETETFNEPITIITDMAMSSVTGFNPIFSITNLEMTGVLNQREEKSDAEKRAEQVVAANKEQQDMINANYMDSDQSGILAAIDTGTDFTQYRNTVLRDVDFYKPEDIYKNVVYRDNVRSMYFLEKGNTDTYKEMVDEQYK